MKAWSQSCHSFHLLRPSHCPVRPKRATPKAPRQCKYIDSTIEINRWNDWSQWGLYIIHLMRRSRCFVFDEQLRVCEVLTSQNQSVQLRLICIYVCPTSAHRGFRYGYRRYKGNTFILETTLFGLQSMVLRSDLTLLNINLSKKSTFAWFFLPKSLYYQWLFVSLQR